MLIRTAITTLALALLVAPAWAQSGSGKGGCGGKGGHGGKPPGGAIFNAPMAKLTERLALTPAQVTNLEKVRADYTAAIAADWAAVKDVKTRMRATWSSGEVPQKADILALQNEMRGHRIRIAAAMVDAKIAGLKTLEPAQRRLLGKMHGQGKGKGMKQGQGQGQGQGKGKGKGRRGGRGR